MKQAMQWIDRYWWVVSLGAAMVVFAVVLLLSIGQSVWFDEGYSLVLAKSDMPELLSLTAVDAHPPLYYVLLRGWGLLFGFEEFTLRMLSAVFAALTAGLGLLLMRRLFGLHAALVAAPVIILAPFMLRYGYELRMYSLAALIGVAATYALVVAQQTKKLWLWALYAVLVALGMYTLYMMIGLWIAHLIWLVWMSMRDRVPVRAWTWFWAYVGAVVLFVPYIPTFFDQLTHSVSSGVGTQVTLTKLVDLATTLFVYLPEWRVNGWVSLLLLGLIVGLIAMFAVAFKKATTRQRPYLVLCALLAGVPLAMAALMSLPPLSPMFLPRYMAHVAPWVYLLLAAVISIAMSLKQTRRRAYVVYGVLTLVLGIGTATLARDGNITFERVQKPRASQLRAEFDDAGLSCGNDTTVVADGPYVYIDTVFYFEDCDMRFYAAEDIEYRGGYAPLSGSNSRLEGTNDVQTPQLVHLRGGNPSLEVDQRYRPVHSIEHDKQFIDIYQISTGN